ncbi:MAG: inositol 2-dehydrogenase [Anaerolineae bacterium]|jgi:myo-inositol 2-dehydrogenase/D-chiro-inositol 1-dehydrogenase
MKNAINVGLVGAGRIGRVHAENLASRIPEANLLAVSDVFVEAAEKLAAELQIPAAYADHHHILDDESVDAVLICSSTDTHAQFIAEAAAAGKQIFCEKPIALDLEAIDGALAAVEEAGVKLMIGFNRRFDPNFKRVREVVAAGEIGQPQVLRITSRDPAPPPIAYVQVSGGLFLDMTIHDFDMARYLMGSEVEQIYAAGEVLVDPDIGQAGDVDTAVITLHFENGALGVIDNSRQAVYGYDQRVEVFGSGGLVTADNDYPNSARISDAHRVHRDLPLNFFMDRYTESYIAEIRTFVRCILNDEPLPVTGVDGRIPVVMGYAAKRSHELGRPVKLDEVEREAGL